MHAVLFSEKHAHLASIAKQRRWLKGFGITPARYEMLFVLANTNTWLGKVHFVYQSDLRRQLGVTAATVSVMLASLEELGLVRRARSSANRREVVIDLTRKARGLLRRVKEMLIKPGYVWLGVYAAFAMSELDVGTFKMYLDDIRKRFGDGSQFDFPWFAPSSRRKRILTS